MRSLQRIFAACCLLGAAFFIGTAKAADFSFDGAAGGISFADYARTAAVAAPEAAPAPAGARVYDFASLYQSLGYPSPDYFGSTEEEIGDLDSYTSKEDAYYGEINGYLRYYPEPYDWYGTGPDEAREMVRRIDNIFGRAPSLPADLVLFRGLGLGYRGDKPFTVGEEFTDKGYVSTSASYKVAYHFAVEMRDEEEKPSRRAIFVLYLARPGVKGLLVEKEGEEEVILGHGRAFRVMAGREVRGKYDLYLVQACSARCDTTLRPDVGAFWDAFTPPN